MRLQLYMGTACFGFPPLQPGLPHVHGLLEEDEAPYSRRKTQPRARTPHTRPATPTSLTSLTTDLTQARAPRQREHRRGRQIQIWPLSRPSLSL